VHRAAAQSLGNLPRPAAARPAAQEKSLRAAEQDRPDVAAARAVWHAELAGIAPERLVFLDESGIDTRLIRTHARAPRGERAVGRVPWERRRLTLIGALGLGGIVARMTVAAATDAAIFLGFLEEVLAPALKRRSDAVVVLDNLSAHKTPAVRAALDRARISYRYLPSYSPDFSPMEPCWAKLKAHFRTRAARSMEALETELPSALRTITPSNAQAWFRHCKYLPE
jgi:transposase